MPNIRLPLDMLGNPIQSLTPSTTVVLAIGVASVSVALPTDTSIVRIANPVAAHVSFTVGTGTAVATDPLLPTMSSEFFTIPAGATFVNMIQEGAVTGNATITRMV